jgi:tetratricopeptide (TPR) repeat protein
MKTSTTNSGLIWYGIAVLFVLGFSILPSRPSNDKWTHSFQVLDSVTKVKDEKIKAKLIEEGGKEILSIYHEHPYHARIQMVVGYYYFLVGNMDSVIYHTTKSLEQGSGGVVNSMEQPAQELLANATINKGFNLLAKGDTLAAFKLYASTARFTPNNPTINKNLGVFYLNQNKPDAALFHYYLVLKNQQRDPEAMLGLARCYLKRGNIDSVRYYANQVLISNPNNQDAQNFLNFTK